MADDPQREIENRAAMKRGVERNARELYRALETIIRQNAGGFPIGHDAIVAGRKALAKASFRRGMKIDWATERYGSKL